LHERIENKLFLDRTRKDSNFKRPHIYATLFQIEKCCQEAGPAWRAGSEGKVSTFSRRSVDPGVASILRFRQTRGSPFTGGMESFADQ
jgi:hypothetical protein